MEKRMATTPDLTDLTRLFHMLSDGTRLRIMLRLAKGESNGTRLCEELKVRQPMISHHLGILRMNRLVIGKRAGREVIYMLAPQAKVAGGKLKISLPADGVTLENYLAPAPDLRELAYLSYLLSEPIRLGIVLLLTKGESNVAPLCEALQLPQPTVSHHLGLLRMNRLVVRQRQGKEVLYTLAPQVKATGGKVKIAVPPFSVTVDGA